MAEYTRILKELENKRERQAATLKATEEHIAAIKQLQNATNGNAATPATKR